MGAIAQLLRSFATVVPTPVMVGIVVILVLVAIPGILRTAHTRQIRTSVREVARSTTQDTRLSREEAAVAHTGRDPHLLFVLVDEALRLNQNHLAERAIAELDATGKLPDDVRRLRARMAPPVVAHEAPIEAIAAIRVLLDEGLNDAARARWTEARVRFPDDPHLAALEQRL